MQAASLADDAARVPAMQSMKAMSSAEVRSMHASISAMLSTKSPAAGLPNVLPAAIVGASPRNNTRAQPTPTPVRASGAPLPVAAQPSSGAVALSAAAAGARRAVGDVGAPSGDGERGRAATVGPRAVILRLSSLVARWLLALKRPLLQGVQRSLSTSRLPTAQPRRATDGALFKP